MSISLVAAQAENRVIGNGPEIPWRVKGEQALFKKITLGGVLVMGRKTFESIGRPLPGRTTIIVTRSANYQVENCLTAQSVEAALSMAEAIAESEAKPIFIAGGGDLYAQTIELADELHLTTIHTQADGDVYFPEVPKDFRLINEESFESNINYTYRYYQRRQIEGDHAV